MSVPMKMHRTSQTIELLIKGPKSGLKELLSLLGKSAFTPIKESKSESIPWESVAKIRIEEFTKPGLALKGSRLKEGLTQIELGNKLGVSQYNISKMEKGKRAIGKKMAMRLSKILKINYKAFL